MEEYELISKIYLIQKQTWTFKECMENIKIFKLRPTLYAGQAEKIKLKTAIFKLVCLILKLSWKFEEYTEE
jgi:hypothetical protein